MSYNPVSSKEVLRHDVVRRLEEFFQVADLRCAECGEWHGDPRQFGIHTEDEWHLRMTRDMLWFGVNAAAVLEALPLLEEEWAESCAVMRNVLRSLA
jgi:hypothetical protein